MLRAAVHDAALGSSRQEEELAKAAQGEQRAALECVPAHLREALPAKALAELTEALLANERSMASIAKRCVHASCPCGLDGASGGCDVKQMIHRSSVVDLLLHCTTC